MKRLVHLLLSSLIICQAMALMPAIAVGDDTNLSHKGAPANTTAPSEASYEFITPQGRNLTLLVRRALQLYDQQHHDIALSEAATIYAETNIVQRLGSRHLDIGDHVKIEESLVDEFAHKSQSLTEAQVAAWRRYASRANFSLNDISPVKTSSARTTEPSPAPSPQPEQGNQQPIPAEGESEIRQNKQQVRPRLRSLWWAAGIVALWAIYSLLGRQNTGSVRRR